MLSKHDSSGGYSPDYEKLNEIRGSRFLNMYKNQRLIESSKAYYRCRPIEFIQDWCITYDPRNAYTDKPTNMPFSLFERQKDLVKLLHSCLIDQENAAIEKCRDAGATWVSCAFSVWAWLFIDGCSIGWGSRKEQLVDKLGDPDSIFEKIRMTIKSLPSFFIPEGIDFDRHLTFMKCINPVNHSTITGEAGDNIGRGGRKTMYFKDESAHYVRAVKIEAALSNNTESQIDISSVNGSNTVFYQRVETGTIWTPGKNIPSGETRVFIFDWMDDPRKDQEWYNRRENKAIREGLEAQFRQEVDRDSNASMDGIIIPNKWIKSSIDAHIKLNIGIEGVPVSGQDVADEGRDFDAQAIRKGILLQYCSAWKSNDPAQATLKCLGEARRRKVGYYQYDCIGVGATVKSKINQLSKDHVWINKTLKISKWDAGSSPLRANGHLIQGDKESPLNIDFFENLKAQAWWELAQRFRKTYLMINDQDIFPKTELISLSSKIPDLKQLLRELSQPIWGESKNMKRMVNKRPSGGEFRNKENKSGKSPNMADAVVMAYWPVKSNAVHI